jgi:threonine synthase
LRLNPAGFKRVLRERRSSNETFFRSGVWRYAELLPPIDREAVVTLNEGNMPLYDSSQGASYAGVDGLAYLHLGMNPTGSFKDLGMTVAISAAKASGARGVVCASTGNTASSMAAYAARGGLEAYALVPRGRVSAAKLAQMRDYGARIVEVDGSFDDALRQLLDNPKAVAGGDLTVVNSTNPYRIEGQKCSAFSILEQRDWKVPDWIIVPGGNLGNSSAIGKGFREALALGLIDRLPRLAIVQASGAAPFVATWESLQPSSSDSTASLAPVEPRTVASAIAIGNPKSWRKALRELRASHGVAVAADDAEILRAKFHIGAEGIGCEPASAASLAGARLLRERNVIAPDADVVCVLTGHVLKDIDTILKYHDEYSKQDEHARV